MVNPNKSKISKTLLHQLDVIDKKHESGKITKRQHDTLSKKAIDKALSKHH